MRRSRAPHLVALLVAIVASTLAFAAPASAGRKPKPTTSTTTSSSTTTSTTTATTTLEAPTYPNRFVETFDYAGWFWYWGIASKPWHTTQVAENGETFVRVSFVKGTHSGASWFFPTGTADDVHLSYRMRLSASWDPSKAASNIKMPGFGSPLLDAAGVCLGGCGLVGADGVTSWSARGDMSQAGVPGSYVYDALTPYGVGYRWSGQTAYQRSRWYTVDVYLHMNAPGSRDGSLVAYVDGRKVFEKRDYVFRLVDTLHAGNVWFDFYYGGSGVAPVDMWIDMDDVVVEW